MESQQLAEILAAIKLINERLTVIETNVNMVKTDNGNIKDAIGILSTQVSNTLEACKALTEKKPTREPVKKTAEPQVSGPVQTDNTTEQSQPQPQPTATRAKAPAKVKILLSEIRHLWNTNDNFKADIRKVIPDIDSKIANRTGIESSVASAWVPTKIIDNLITDRHLLKDIIDRHKNTSQADVMKPETNPTA